MIEVSDKHQNIKSISYAALENSFEGQVDIISPQEAYQEVLAGNFQLYNDLTKGDELLITEYELSYEYDSKGYYQPIYKFMGERNNVDDWEAKIPALKDR